MIFEADDLRVLVVAARSFNLQAVQCVQPRYCTVTR